MRLPGHRRSPDSWLGDGIAGVSDLDALLSWVPDLADRDVYICGPGRWADLVSRDLAAAGLTSDQIHLETFAW